MLPAAFVVESSKLFLMFFFNFVVVDVRVIGQRVVVIDARLSAMGIFLSDGRVVRTQLKPDVK